jgi:hypothetical protein
MLLLILLLILLIIIFFVNNDYIFKIIEGNTCKFSGDEKLKKNTENTANNHKKKKPDQSKTEATLSRVEGANVDI